LKWVLREIGWGGMDWIDLVQDRDYMGTLVNTVMNLSGFHKLVGVAANLVASQEGLSSMMSL
jgi:hypothetical protein